MDNEPLEEKQYWLQQQLNGAIVIMVFATPLVGLHLLALQMRRKQMNIRLGWNSELIIASLIVFCLHCAATMVNARANWIYYKTTNEAEQLVYNVITAKSSYAMSVTYPIAFTLPKLMISTLYLQIFSVNDRARRTIIGLIVFLIINCVAWLVPTLAVCRPVSAFWNVEGHQGKCLNYNVFGTWISLPNIVIDLLMLILPIPLLWKMKIGLAKKLGLNLTFAIGCGGIVGGFLRLDFYVHRTYVERPGTDQTTRSTALNNIVSYTECGLYLIAASLPVLRVIFVHLCNVLDKRIESFLQRCRSSGRSSNNPQIDLKLTGVGKLDTLLRKGNQVGVSLAESVANEKIPRSTLLA